MGGPGSGRKAGGGKGKNKPFTSRTINTTAGKQKIQGRELSDGSFQVSRFPKKNKRK